MGLVNITRENLRTLCIMASKAFPPLLAYPLYGFTTGECVDPLDPSWRFDRTVVLNKPDRVVAVEVKYY